MLTSRCVMQPPAETAARPQPLACFRVRTEVAMRRAAVAESSCSQIRSTSQPADRSAASTSESRRTFRSILGPQYDRLVRGGLKWVGHACQKQPSTNTATRARVNTRSAVLVSVGSGVVATRNLRPSRCAARRTASSGFVSRLRFPRITARTAGLEAHDPVETVRASARIIFDLGWRARYILMMFTTDTASAVALRLGDHTLTSLQQ